MPGKRILSATESARERGTISGNGWVATFTHNHLPDFVLSGQWSRPRIKCSGGLDILTINFEMSKFDFWAAARTGKDSHDNGLSPVGERILKILRMHVSGFTAKSIAEEMDLPTTTVRKVLKQLKSTQAK